MNRLANFMLRSNPIVEAKKEEIRQPVDQHGEYPVTISWSDGEKTYLNEFDLLVDCLERAPDLVWYTKVLVHAKPDMLKALQEKENKLTPRVNEPQKKLPVVAKAEQVPMFAMGGGGHYYEQA